MSVSITMTGIIRLLAGVGMGLSIWFLFIDIQDEQRCDRSEEVAGGHGEDQMCLLPKSYFGLSARIERLRSFEQARLRIVTDANKRKLKVELEQQEKQVRIESGALANLLAGFGRECQTDTEALLADKRDRDDRKFKYDLNNADQRFSTLRQELTAMSPQVNGTDLCYTAPLGGVYAMNNWDQCVRHNLPDANLQARSLVAVSTVPCNVSVSKLLFEGSINSEACKNHADHDADCGDVIWRNAVKCWCVRRGQTCNAAPDAAIGSSAVLENQADAFERCSISTDQRYDPPLGTPTVAASLVDCQVACNFNADCVTFSFNATSGQCTFHDVSATLTADTGYTSGPQQCDVCADDAVANCASRFHDCFSETMGAIETVGASVRRSCPATCGLCSGDRLVVDVQCGWTLDCRDAEAKVYCDLDYPGLCQPSAGAGSGGAGAAAPAETTTTITTTAFCAFAGIVTFNVQLNSATIGWDSAGRPANHSDPRWPSAPQWQMEEIAIEYDPRRGTLTKVSTGQLLGTQADMGLTMSVTCGDIGGCGYEGQAIFQCKGAVLEYDFTNCRTTPGRRQSCYEQRIDQADVAEAAEEVAINTEWAAVNTSYAQEVSNSLAAIDQSVATFTGDVLPNVQGLPGTKELLNEIDRQIGEVSADLQQQIEDDYTGNYHVKLGERYRVGCAHDTAAESGLGLQADLQGLTAIAREPGLASGFLANTQARVEQIRDHAQLLEEKVRNSPDFNEFLLQRCDDTARGAGKCGGEVDGHSVRSDLDALYGEGRDPKHPPMKMPAYSSADNDSATSARHNCLGVPCLDQVPRQYCAEAVRNRTIALQAFGSGRFLGISSLPGLPPILQDPVASFHVVAVPGTSNQLHVQLVNGVKSLQETATGPSFATTSQSISQSWKLIDAGQGYVYLQSHLGHLLEECSANSQYGSQCGTGDVIGMALHFGNSSKWRVLEDSVATCENFTDSGSRDAKLTCPGTLRIEGFHGQTAGSAGVEVPSFTCTAAYDLMQKRWDAWLAGEGARRYRALEVETFNQHYKIMQDAFKEWKTWEFNQDAYIEEAVEIKECAVGVSTMGALETGAGSVASKKDAGCHFGNCSIDECVKVSTHCKLGRPTGEATFQCFGRTTHRNKRLDYMLIGLFWLVLSILFFIGAGFLSGENGRQRKVSPEDAPIIDVSQLKKKRQANLSGSGPPRQALGDSSPKWVEGSGGLDSTEQQMRNLLENEKAKDK